MSSAFVASGLGRSEGSAHWSRMKGATRIQAEPCHAAGTVRLSWSTQMVPTPSHHGAVAHAEWVHSDRIEQFGLGHAWVVNEREHSRTVAYYAVCPRTVAYYAVYPNTHGPVTRRARCRAGSERVQRDRVETFGLCHAWVTIESRSIPKPRRVVRIFSFGTQQ